MVDIWKYRPVDGFKKVTTGRGITYYEQAIALSKDMEFFSVTFTCRLDGHDYIITNVLNDAVDLICDSQKYAKAHEFLEIERGVWVCRKPINDFTEFVMIKRSSRGSEQYRLSADELKAMWDKYVTEVSI
jgi:hypothetical protein